MDKNTNVPGNPELIQAVNGKVPEGYLAADWDIMLKKRFTKGKLQELVNDLLARIRRHTFRDQMQTTSLAYQFFKSKNKSSLYNLRVYRSMKPTSNKPEGGKPNTRTTRDAEGPTKTSGPKVPVPPKTQVMEIVSRNFEEHELIEVNP